MKAKRLTVLPMRMNRIQTTRSLWSAGWLALICGMIFATNSWALTTNVFFTFPSFTPSSVTIHVGDTVVFTNTGGSHTVTGTGSDPICGNGTVPTSCSHTFNTAGTFPYQCMIPGHASSGMTGQVAVLTANLPPSVSITNPVNSAVFAIAPTNILIQASASGNSGATVTNVQFFSNGTTLLGATNSAPFKATFTNATAGSYALTAVAKDNNGLSTTSSIVNITVNAAPSVSITNPVNNAKFVAPFNGTIQASATDSDDSVAKVEFFKNGSSVGLVTNAPYNLPINLPAGNYSLTAQATDNRNAMTLSSAVNISVITNATLSSPQKTTNSFQFNISSISGQTYIVEGSTNLGNTNSWVPLSTNTPGTTSFNFDDTSTNLTKRFYRVKSQ